MKFLIVALAFVACAYADVSELGYSYEAPAPVQQPKNTYIPPAAPAPVPVQQPKSTYIPPAAPAPAPAPVVEEIKSSYIPPPAPAPAPIEEPKNTYIPPVSGEAIESAAQDGYRYKTVRRVVYRHRA